MKQQYRGIAVFLGLVALGAGSRLLFKDWIANFHAVTAVTLFAGFYFRNWVVALAVPVASMLISDFGIENYDAEVRSAVYLGLVLPLLFRPLLRMKLSAMRVGISSISSSLLFFLISNLAVWHAWRAHTLQEFMNCYLEALPFYQTSLIADLIFSFTLFGAYALVRNAAQTDNEAQGELEPMGAAA